MKTYSVTEAKAKLGPLADLALKKRPIFIRRGRRMLQLVEATLPEPIPHYPEGHFAVSEERAEYLNSLPVDSSPLDPMNPVRQWDIVKVRINANDRDEHPAIVLSPLEIASSPHVDRINVIYGSTRRPAQDLRPAEVVLDEADGLDHLTVFDCLLFPVVKKAAITGVIGHVSTERKRHLHRTLVAALRLFS